MRPWAIALYWYVHGFPDATHARQFEAAWQKGFRSSNLAYSPFFKPSAGLLGNVEILKALLFSQWWYALGLSVHIVDLSADATLAERNLHARIQNVLCTYAFVTYGPHL